MPSKSDIQLGKIVVANHFATKEEIETSLKDQVRFERERHTIILEALLLSKDYLTLEQIEAIQGKMKRRVIFCPKCRGKFNVFQFRGSERFLCHKCGNKVTVPDGEEYRQDLKTLAEKAKAFFEESPEPAPEEGAEPRQRETIMLKKEDIEKIKEEPSPSGPADEEDILEPAEEVEAAIEEEEVEAEIEEESAEEPGEPEEPATLRLEDEVPEEEKAKPAKMEEPEKPAKKAKPEEKKGKVRKVKKFKKKKPGQKEGGDKGKQGPGKLKRRKEPREGKPRFRRKK